MQERTRTIHRTFEVLGDYDMFLPLDGAVTVDAEDEIVHFNVGGTIGAEDIEDGIEIEFKGNDGNYYYQQC